MRHRRVCHFEQHAPALFYTMAQMLDEFVTVNRAEIITRCRAKVAVRSGPQPAAAALDHGVPMFLDQLLDELRDGTAADAAITTTATKHGRDLLAQGYTVSQVVHDYGDVCQAVTELAVERHAAISSSDFRTLNRCLDDAIAGAVTEYGRGRDQQRDGTAAVRGEGRATLANDLATAIRIATYAFEAIKDGRVGVSGSTGTVLALGLDTAADLVQRLVADAGNQS
jgi:hypothetical protein